jgi:hypothetical protein
MASPARRMSFSLARASEQTVDSLTMWAMACDGIEIAGRGGGEAGLDDIDPHAARSWRATRSFSSLVMEAPGLCSPSLQGGVEDDQAIFAGVVHGVLQ